MEQITSLYGLSLKRMHLMQGQAIVIVVSLIVI
jgi:hypothetical protein